MVYVHHRYVETKSIRFFYREAGPTEAPTVLLLHGYPTSSHMFRHLIPQLADRWHIIAPDLPSFGSTQSPPRGEYDYTFANLAQALGEFVDALSLDRVALYVFDYGAPTGFRWAVAHPERVSAIVTQNGNAYEEGLLSAWDPVKDFWSNPTPEGRNALRKLQTEETTRWQYAHGVPEEKLTLISPDPIQHDQAILDRPDSAEIQLDLIADYRSNLERYPEWHAYFRSAQPPLLAVWGQNDPFFGPAGAKAYRRDLPDAEIHLFDTGHFALETHGPDIAAHMRAFFDKHL